MSSSVSRTHAGLFEMSVTDQNVQRSARKLADLFRSFPHVLHVTSWLSRQGGGIPPVVWALNREMRARNVHSRVVGLGDHFVAEDCAGENPPPITGSIIGPRAIGFSPRLKRHLRVTLNKGDVVHVHGLWMYPGFAARKCARRIGCSFVMSPHGMLEPWALNNSRFKKRLVAHLFENKNLHEADCLHALCSAEAESFRRYGLKNPIAIIPNGVAENELCPPSLHGAADGFPSLKGRRRLLFLSRLHPKKGLENLISAWCQMAHDFSGWTLVIAGSGEVNYEEKLKTLAGRCGTRDSIVFTGPVYGENKKRLLFTSDAFILPSFSEGFSMAILEAAAAALPVVLTRECNFPELTNAGAAFETAPNVTEIESVLRRILTLSEENRKAMGRRGQELVKKFYTWRAVTDQMCAVYEWLAGHGPQPESVITT